MVGIKIDADTIQIIRSFGLRENSLQGNFARIRSVSISSSVFSSIVDAGCFFKAKGADGKVKRLVFFILAKKINVFRFDLLQF